VFLLQLRDRSRVPLANFLIDLIDGLLRLAGGRLDLRIKIAVVIAPDFAFQNPRQFAGV
jgi:hypothetical protein